MTAQPRYLTSTLRFFRRDRSRSTEMSSEDQADMTDSTAAPFFSVVVSTFNRCTIIRRCVDSVLASDYDNFELVVVDDGSSDDTAARLAEVADPRLRVVTHEHNKGMSPARHTGMTNARGEWIVVIDSDWELYPQALSRLSELTDDLSDDIGVVWSRLRWDDGTISPAFIPEGPVNYEQRLRFWDEEGGSDAIRCIRRPLAFQVPYDSARRGAMDYLHELDLARAGQALFVPDVLGAQHFDAQNSWLRSSDLATVGPRLLAEAPDMLWMTETALARHGTAIRRLAPGLYRALLLEGVIHALLIGRRGAATRLVAAAARAGAANTRLWLALALGLIHRRLLLFALLRRRQITASRSMPSQSEAPTA